MDNVSSQVSGSSSVLAADWNTYVRDNFDDIKAGHIVVATPSDRTALGVVAAGTMVFEASTSKLWVYTTGWFELANFLQNTAVGSGGAPFAPFFSPVGMITPFGGAAAPSGWLLCDGSAVSRTGVYTALFSVCSTTYGTGDGSTTFNLPNLLGRSVVGAGVAGKANGYSSSGSQSVSFATTATTGNGTTATITTALTHAFAVGSTVVVAGITPSGYNGTYTVTAVGANTVSYANATTGGQTVAGTIVPSSITARTLGAFFGDLNTQLHTHAISAWATTDGAGAHTHGVSHVDQVYGGTGAGIWPSGNNGANGQGYGNQTHYVTTDGAHNHTLPATTSVAYGTGVQQNNQPNLALTYIIKY
jgi:microcystin-dependent protein